MYMALDAHTHTQTRRQLVADKCFRYKQIHYLFLTYSYPFRGDTAENSKNRKQEFPTEWQIIRGILVRTNE